MLNESKIKLMTGISMIEKDKGKDLAIVHRYFKGDYIGRHMLCAFLGYTFCWCLGLLLVAACKVFPAESEGTGGLFRRIRRVVRRRTSGLPGDYVHCILYPVPASFQYHAPVSGKTEEPGTAV